MDSSLKIDFNEVRRVVLETVRANRSTTEDTLINALKSNYPNVNTVHLRYKLSGVMRQLKDEKAIQETEKHRIDFGRNLHLWTQHICLLDSNIIQCLKELDKHLEEVCLMKGTDNK